MPFNQTPVPFEIVQTPLQEQYAILLDCVLFCHYAREPACQPTREERGSRTNVAPKEARRVAMIAVPPARMLDVVGKGAVNVNVQRGSNRVLCLLTPLSNGGVNPRLINVMRIK